MEDLQKQLQQQGEMAETRAEYRINQKDGSESSSETMKFTNDLLTAYISYRQADSMKSSFIGALLSHAGDVDPETQISRVHPSLVLDTATGRLACRAPNLQNQPSLERDVYKVRAAVKAEPGNTLLVCDFGQLELRVLAHETRCESMCQYFRDGGDFHSLTAKDMFHVQLEGVSVDEVKEKYPSMRKEAKCINFGIAYGRQPFSIARELSISEEDARDLVERWYAQKGEVKEWKTISEAHMEEKKATKSLFGRERILPHVTHPVFAHKQHSLRAGINHQIQGSAADIVMLAMLCIDSDKRLNELGYKLILQVHDELILEGPEEYADEALGIVRDCMSKPWKSANYGEDTGWGMEVQLSVDGKCGDTWYDCK